MEQLQRKKKPDTMYLVATIIYVMMFFKGRHLLAESDLSMTLKGVISGLVVLSFIFCLFLYVRRARNLDELERRIQLDALLLAFPLTIIFSFTLAQLELFIPFLRDDWSYMRATAINIVFYYAGLIIARRRYA